MLEYPEINTIVKQMAEVLPGKTVESGEVVKKIGNLFMSDEDAAKYSLLRGGTVVEIDRLEPDIYIKLDNGYGILFCQCGGRILYNETQADAPRVYNIIFRFTDGSSLTYTMSLFSLGIYAVSHEDWANRKKSSAKFDPLGGSFGDYMDFVSLCDGQEKTPMKIFLATYMRGIMSTFAAEILLYAQIYPSTQLKKLSAEEHRRVYEAMQKVLTSACDLGGRVNECDLYGKKGKYVAMAERKHIGEPCPVCAAELGKVSVGGVTAFCPQCQVKKK